MRRFVVALFTLIAALCLATLAFAAPEFDSELHQKAQDYTDYLMEWHSTGYGGVSDVLFTDDTRQELERMWGSGDSGDWTGTYLVSQAIRYIVTGEQEARDEVIRIGNYMHLLKEVTGDPGYLARYAAPNEPPWNLEYPGADNVYPCVGYDNCFWIGHNVRDKYITWYWGLAWVFDALEGDEGTDAVELRQIIKEDFRDVTLTLRSNDWTITDPWGDVYTAAAILDDIRLAILVQTAHVIDEPEFWDMLDEEYENAKWSLLISSISVFNVYEDYYAFINNYSNAQPLFRLWPDRERFNHIFGIWLFNVREWSQDTHQTFFDAVWYGACLRYGQCDTDEMEQYKNDMIHGLRVMWEAPNYEREVTCRDDLPLDNFSVWADQFLADNPWITDLTGFDIDPQTAVAHELDDRCWSSVMWERTPYHIECTRQENQAHTAHGADFLIAYWLGVWYGIVPGGEQGDAELIDDDADDDVNDDLNDDADDDVNDDDADDDLDDDTDDDQSGVPSPDDSSGDDDDDEDCCGR
jgi:hypothetical protein